MYVQLLFGISVAFGFAAWAVITALYIWPELQARSRIEALRPLLALHGFRFIGLSFLVPGVVLNAFYVANGAGLLAGQLGAAYFIPTAIVPLLLITHGLVFRKPTNPRP
jgi:hypothetical protein